MKGDSSDRLTPVPVRKLVVSAVVAGALHFALVFISFGCWVSYFYAGNFSGPLWISTLFGTSQEAYVAGARPVFEAPTAGWDGQFYYTQSNDPFALKVRENSKLIDNPSYRYQRCGLPVIAWAVSRLIGEKQTSPLTYFVVGFGISSIAFAILVAYLMMHSINPAWALIWGLYGGVLRPMIHGLPDATADSFLLFSILAVVQRNLFVYSLACTVLCLCRESYAAPAFVIWVATLLNQCKWRSRAWAICQWLIAAVPGIVVLGWAVYIARATQTPILSGSRSIPWGGLVDWPFFAYFRSLMTRLVIGEIDNDVIFSTSCALVIAIVMFHLVAQVRSNPITISLLVHVLIMSMTGWIIWEAGVGYFKNTGSVILIAVVLQPRIRSKLLKWAILVSFACSVVYVYRSDFRRMAYLPPLEETILRARPTSVVALTKPCEHVSSITVLKISQMEFESSRMFGPFLRVPIQIDVRVTNDSSQTWPASLPGDGVVALAFQILNHRDRVINEGRVALHETVRSGESIQMSLTVPSMAQLSSQQTIRIAMVQDGDSWFDRDDKNQRIEIPNRTPFDHFDSP